MPAGRAGYLPSRATDLAGQTVDYTYFTDEGRTYLDSITWGPDLPTCGPAHRTTFAYEPRPDAVPSWRTGALVTTPAQTPARPARRR